MANRPLKFKSDSYHFNSMEQSFTEGDFIKASMSNGSIKYMSINARFKDFHKNISFASRNKMLTKDSTIGRMVAEISHRLSSKAWDD